MATLYVENVPEDRYEALRSQARKNHRSIAAEVLSLMEEHVPTAEELASRQKLFELALELSKQKPLAPGPFPSAEEMLREDRDR